MKPKIGLFVASLGGGGAERVMVTLANNFARRAYPTQLVIAYPDLTYANELVPQVQLINLNTYRMMRTIIPLARYLRAERPDALLATLTEVNMTAVVARILARVPTRVVVREASTPTRQLLQSPHRKQRLIGKLQGLLYQGADAVVAISKGVYRDLVQNFHLPPEKIALIYNPVPLQQIYTLMHAPVDHPWFQPSSSPVILSVGRLDPAKDYPTLIRAFAQVRSTIEARLLILGEGAERNALQQLINQLQLRDSVQMPGFDPNPFRYMRRASLYVLSSRYEGFPNALVQALACGCPVVSTDCESGPRDILNEGQYGRLVPVGDANQMAQAILSMLKTPLPPAPPQWLLQFDEEHVTDQMLRVLLPEFTGAMQQSGTHAPTEP